MFWEVVGVEVVWVCSLFGQPVGVGGGGLFALWFLLVLFVGGVVLLGAEEKPKHGKQGGRNTPTIRRSTFNLEKRCKTSQTHR